jgi:hypothetical protein
MGMLDLFYGSFSFLMRLNESHFEARILKWGEPLRGEDPFVGEALALIGDGSLPAETAVRLAKRCTDAGARSSELLTLSGMSFHNAQRHAWG